MAGASCARPSKGHLAPSLPPSIQPYPIPFCKSLTLHSVPAAAAPLPRHFRAPSLRVPPNRSLHIRNTSSTNPRRPITAPSVKYLTRHGNAASSPSPHPDSAEVDPSPHPPTLFSFLSSPPSPNDTTLLSQSRASKRNLNNLSDTQLRPSSTGSASGPP